MIYLIVRFLAVIVLKFAFFFTIRGRQNCADIPTGFILISNHKSNWDPITLGISVPGRPVYYLAKEELFRNRAARFFLTRLHAIPLARGAGDIGAVKQALRLLRNGEVLGIFPEGTRSKTGELKPFAAGAALLSLRSGFPVVPAYISGTYKLFHHVGLELGKAIDLKTMFPGKINTGVIRQATGVLEEAIQALAGIA